MNAVLLLISLLIPSVGSGTIQTTFSCDVKRQAPADSCDGVLCAGPAYWILMIQVSFFEHCSMLPAEIKM